MSRYEHVTDLVERYLSAEAQSDWERTFGPTDVNKTSHACFKTLEILDFLVESSRDGVDPDGIYRHAAYSVAKYLVMQLGAEVVAENGLIPEFDPETGAASYKAEDVATALGYTKEQIQERLDAQDKDGMRAAADVAYRQQRLRKSGSA